MRGFDARLVTDLPDVRDRVRQCRVEAARHHVPRRWETEEIHRTSQSPSLRWERWALLAAMRSVPTSQRDTSRTKIVKLRH